MVRSRGEWFVPIVASLVLCSLVAPAVVAGATGQSGGHDAYAQGGDIGTLQGFDADRTEFRITVYENGSAEWLFRYEQRLADDQERQDFRTFAEEFNNNETELYANFRERAVSLTDSGTNTTGREMSAENFQRDARIEGFEDNLGVVEMSFRWEGFAVVDDRVAMGDVFEGGLYLGPDQRLVIRPGPNLAFAEIEPGDGELSGDTASNSDSVTWTGERSFTDNRPRIVFADPATLETPTATETPAEGNPGWLLPVGVLVLVVLVGLGAAVAYRSGSLPPGGEGATTVTGGGSGGGGAAAESTDDTATEAGPAVPDEELISDEERVVNLLEGNGGRMKQVNIVDETGWSKSKVSMLLSDMEDEGTISKLRVGRENIVSLAGHEPDAAGSPFEDED